MEVFEWIERTFPPRTCNSEAFFYNDMASQSGYCLPVIYQPFDAARRGHWADRGAMFDFLFATQGEGKKLLDFGPGDGWPSLIVAPWAGEVVGVDGSLRRVEVCTENAHRMGITNARFVHVEPGQPLPFDEASFDGVMAASSIEQTPDPAFTLQELYRVLRPGGRLRVSYEGLGRYRNGLLRAADFDALNAQSCALTLYDRNVEQETADMMRLILSGPLEEMQRQLLGDKPMQWENISTAALESLRPWMVDARRCTLRHPSAKTYASWMIAIGFREVQATHSGTWFAGRLFMQLAEAERPKTLDEVDALLHPLVEIVVQMNAPLVSGPVDRDPMITAVK